jgi:hypothetical protein
MASTIKSAHELIVEKIPGHSYEPIQFDRLFKELVTIEWCVKSDGHVESPQGYFAIVEIPSHPGELNEMMEALSTPYDFPASGWFITVEDNMGFIFVYRTSGEAQANELYDLLLDQYVKWDAE